MPRTRDSGARRASTRDGAVYPDDGISAADVVDYYRAVADVLLPHLRGRGLTARRFPDGIDAQGEARHELDERGRDRLPMVRVPRGDGDVVRHGVCEDTAALLHLVRDGCLEFHVTLATVASMGCPDELLVELEPPDGMPVSVLRGAARQVRDLFDRLGLVPFLMTTGGRGLYVVAPLDGHSSYQLVTPLADDIAALLAEREPGLFAVAGSAEPAGHRLVLDTTRNARAQTVIAPYSLRAHPGAPIATPLDWSELGRVAPASHRLRNLRRRLGRKADPWAGLAEHARPAGAVRGQLDALRTAP